jgi:predicted nucleotidyltransferase
MEDEILLSLERLEKQENIKILFACESGSRAWGTNSVTSDFDVRFIYSRKINWYLQIHEGRDVIETTINQNIEFVGWDIKKSLRLLQKSNPTLLEWINSPIIYFSRDTFLSDLKKLSITAFSPTPAVYHYVNMAKKNYQILQKETDASTKRYINILRPLITCLWILEHEEMPAIDVISLFHLYVLDPVIHKEFEMIIHAKKIGQRHFNSEIINHYVEETIPFIEKKVKKTRHQNSDLTNELNQFFFNIVTNTN